MIGMPEFEKTEELRVLMERLQAVGGEMRMGFDIHKCCYWVNCSLYSHSNHDFAARDARNPTKVAEAMAQSIRNLFGLMQEDAKIVSGEIELTPDSRSATAAPNPQSTE